MNTRFKLSTLAMNEGQIEGLPRNPREWASEDVERLAKSIQETPELLEARPLIVFQQGPKFIVLGGNLRFAALKKLKWKDAPCYLLPIDTPVEKMKEIVIKDNGSFGEWDYDALANEWDDLDLSGWGTGVPDDWGKVKEPQAPAPAGAGGIGGGINIDGLFDPNKQPPKQPEIHKEIVVCIPTTMEDKEPDIRASLQVTIEEFPGVYIK